MSYFHKSLPRSTRESIPNLHRYCDCRAPCSCTQPALTLETSATTTTTKTRLRAVAFLTPIGVGRDYCSSASHLRSHQRSCCCCYARASPLYDGCCWTLSILPLLSAERKNELKEASVAEEEKLRPEGTKRFLCSLALVRIGL